MHSSDVLIIVGDLIRLSTVFQTGMLGMKCHANDAQKTVGEQCIALHPEKPICDIPAYRKIAAAELIKRLELQVTPFNLVYQLNQQAALHKNEVFHYGFFK